MGFASRRPIPHARRAAAPVAAAAVVAALLVAAPATTAPPAAGAAAAARAAVGPPVTGTVFRDFDQDGVRDPLEPGQAGVRVSARGPSGGAVSTVSAADGTYSLDVADLAGSRFRVTFSDWPDYLQPSAHGAGNGTDVQFAAAGGTADFAVTNPAQFCSASAEIATTCYQGGTAAADGPAVVAFPQDAGTASTTSNDGAASSSLGEGMGSHADLAFDDVVGPVRGLAWRRSSGTIFASAYAKRHTAYPSGPTDSGPDRIYAVPRSGGAPSVFFAADAGTDEHDYADLVADAGFWDQVGRSGWGDIDLSEDEQTLYAANMLDRQVYAIAVSGSPPVAGAAETIDLGPLASADCGGDDWVPGGVKAHDGLVYLTATCTAATSQDRADLQGLVYSYEPGSGDLARVAAFPLTYARGPVSALNAPSAWLPWSATEQFRPTPTDPNPYGQVYYPQPWLTDVEVDESGRMLLGVTDRAGDQFGNDNGAGPAGNNEGVAAGDTLVLPRAAGGTWSAPAGGDDLASEQHPLAGPTHTEISLGHLALRLGSGTVVTNAYDPAPTGGPVRTADGATVLFPQSYRSGGLITMNTGDGTRARSYQLFGIDSPGTFGKAAGVGDVELLCDAAPLEIGDYVWIDADGDGQQDADEAPVAGATVRLYDADDVLVATTTTDASGRWYFPVDPDTDYTVRLDNPADYAPGGPLDGLVLTGDDRGADASDSDATTVAGFPRIPVSTGGPGANDHTLDVGFAPGYSLGNQIWIDTDRDGRIDAGEPRVPGVVVTLLDANGDPVLGPDGRPLTSTTDANGFYLFDDLPAGQYVVVVGADNFVDGGPLDGHLSTPPTSRDPDDDVDDDDNGFPGPEGAVVSGPITLGPGEPTGESPDTDPGTPDDQSNLTVDFGFVPRTADLEVTKTLDGVLTTGAVARYELTVTNRGPDATASTVVVEDAEPAGLDLLDAAGDGWDCRVLDALVRCRYDAALAPGEEATVVVRARVLAGPGEEVANGATVALSDPPPAPPGPGDVPDTVDPQVGNDGDTVVTAVETPVPPEESPDGGDLPDAGSSVPPWSWWVAWSCLFAGAGLLILHARRHRPVAG